LWGSASPQETKSRSGEVGRGSRWKGEVKKAALKESVQHSIRGNYSWGEFRLSFYPKGGKNTVRREIGDRTVRPGSGTFSPGGSVSLQSMP